MQTVDHGQAGRPEPGDELRLTFAGAPEPAAILAAWSGSATPVTVHFEGVGDDVITVLDASTGATLAELGSIQANRDYTSGSADFTNSQMTLAGTTITIVLGTPSRPIGRDPSAKALVWTTPHGSATESGHPDSDF